MQPDLRLFLLGNPRLVRGDDPLVMDTRKAIALLTYLVFQKAPVSRDSLATLFWPDNDQERARAALRRTLSSLRGAIGEHFLLAERETIQLRVTSSLWVDAVEFQDQIKSCDSHGHPAGRVCPRCLEPLSLAVSLYQGLFMAGFSLRDSIGFDDWQFDQAEYFRMSYASALERLVNIYTQVHEFQKAIEFSRKWLLVDPLHEPAQRNLMALYGWTGQRPAALRLFQDCERKLQAELGVRPVEETRRLYQEIKDNRLPPPPPKLEYTSLSSTQEDTSEIQPQPKSLAPLVGREGEWAILINAYEKSRHAGYLVCLEGEPGVGKTRLVEEFGQYVSGEGGLALFGRCYEGERGLAYNPVLQCVRMAVQAAGALWHKNLSEIARNELGRLIPDLAPPGVGSKDLPVLDENAAQTRLFEALSEAIIQLSGRYKTCLLVLDDLQWSDEASWEWLAYFLRRLPGHPILVMVTWRDDLIPPGHRLRRLYAEITRQDRGTLIKMVRWSYEQVAQLVQSVEHYRTNLPDKAIRRLYRETDGLPFFVLQYMDAWQQSGQPPDIWPMPSGVRALLQSRMAEISETGCQILQAIAVWDQVIDLESLRVASGRTEEEIVNAVEALEARHILVDVSTEPEAILYDFTHEKIRDVVYEDTSHARRKLLHKRVAETLVSVGRRDHSLPAMSGKIAFHFLRAGLPSDAAEYFQLAGDYAFSVHAYPDALSSYLAALQYGATHSVPVKMMVGGLQVLLGQYTTAIDTFREIIHDLPPHSLESAKAQHALGEVYARRGDFSQARQSFQQAFAIFQSIGITTAMVPLLGDWSSTEYRSGEIEAASELAERALSMALQVNDSAGEAYVENMLGRIARNRGEIELAHEHAQRSLTLAEAVQNDIARIAAMNNLALVYGQQGFWEEALKVEESAVALSLKVGDRHRQAALHNNLADFYHRAGNDERAMEELKKAVRIFSEIGVEGTYAPPEIWKLTDW